LDKGYPLKIDIPKSEIVVETIPIKCWESEQISTKSDYFLDEKSSLIFVGKRPNAIVSKEQLEYEIFNNIQPEFLDMFWDIYDNWEYGWVITTL